MGAHTEAVESLSAEELARIDKRLCALGRGEGALRLRVGQCAAEIHRRSLYKQLGYSSFGDFATQRCSFGASWLKVSRRVAEQLANLPQLRLALQKGELSWSMAELCARKSTPASEGNVLEKAKQSTVRQMDAWFRGGCEQSIEPAANEAPPTSDPPSEKTDWRETWDEEDWNDYPSGRAANLTLAGRADELPTEQTSAEPRPKPERINPLLQPLDLEATAADLDLLEELRRVRRRTLRRRVAFDERLAFELTTMMASHMTGSQHMDTIIDAILSEAESTLIGWGATEALATEDELHDQTQEWMQWLQTCAAQREAGEESCESAIPEAEEADLHEGLHRPLPLAATELDDELVGLCVELSRRDLEMGALFDQLLRGEGLQRLRYASIRQYARERVGVSKSSLEHKRTLARRGLKLPGLTKAVAEDQIGYVAAQKIARIATPETVGAWIERAEKATVKHLEEEILAAELLARNGAISTIRPPTETELAAVFAVEETLLSGDLLPKPPTGWHDDDLVPGDAANRDPRAASCKQTQAEASVSSQTKTCAVTTVTASELSQMSNAPKCVIPEGTGADFSEAPQRSHSRLDQMVATAREELLEMIEHDSDQVQGLPKAFSKVFRHRGKVTLPLRMSDDLALRWKALEQSHRRLRGKQESFIMFLCMVVWREWSHIFTFRVQFKHIHERDRFRCLSPVCSSRSIGPHHMQRRSQGGDDTKDNNVSACYICHIPGIHQAGWLKVERIDGDVRWTIGREPTLIVKGRTIVLNRRSSLQRAA